MTAPALCDRPNIAANELHNMLSLAMPSLAYTGGYEWILESGDFICYHPDALPHLRWQITEIILDAPNYRYTRNDGYQGRKTKRVSKRFATLLEAVTYYEMEIKR